MADITIYHNPNCQTSRKALAFLRETGHAPEVVEYLKAGWTKPQLQDLFAAMDKSPRDLLRLRGDLAEEMGLTKAGVGDEAIVDAMISHPVLVERPIVVTPKGTVLARPIENLNTVI